MTPPLWTLVISMFTDMRIVRYTSKKDLQSNMYCAEDYTTSHERVALPEELASYVPNIQLYRFKSLDVEDNDGVPEAHLTREFTVELDANALHTDYVYLLKLDESVLSSSLELASLPDMRPERSYWSGTMSHTVNINSNVLRDQLRLRYAFFDPPRDGLLNVVLDSFIPKLMYQTYMSPLVIPEIYKVPKTAVAISPWFASLLGVKQIPLSDLIAILGYTEKNLRQIFKVIRAKKLSLELIGYGGTTVNTITWLSELSKLLNAPQIFNKITVYEADTVEVSNLFRFPLDPRQNSNTYSVNCKGIAIPKLNLINESIYRLAPVVFKQNYYYKPCKLHPHAIRYGAPDIATRAKLSMHGNFISATHSNQSCRIDLNPKQVTALQVESYGVISLATFFMNQLKMAISFIELLASDQDLKEQDKTILEYTFNGKALLKPSRHYSFQLEHTGLLPQEEV